MKQRLVIFFFLCAAVSVMAQKRVIEYDATHLILCDYDLHLQFMLDKSTQTATLGNGIDKDYNAVFTPDLGDPWWFESPQRNFWETVIVPDTVEWDGTRYPVTEVASNAFYRWTSIHKVFLPATIRRIGSSAFQYCVELKEIDLPDGITEIQSNAFYGCTQITEIKWPSKLESIGSGAFLSCKKLKSAHISASCQTIGNDAFSWCISLDDIVFEDSNDPIYLGAAYIFGEFWEPYSSPYNYAKPVPRGLFNDCPLKTLYMGRNIAILPQGNSEVEQLSPFEHIYQQPQSETKVTILRRGHSFSRITLSDKVTRLCDGLFQESTTAEKFVLPPKLEYIGSHALEGMALKSLTIPATCTYLGDYALARGTTTDQMTLLRFEGTTPPQVGKYVLSMQQSLTLQVPAGARQAFAANPEFADYTIMDAADPLYDIKVSRAGTLNVLLLRAATELPAVRRLKLSGSLNKDDYEVLTSLEHLYELDLSQFSMPDLTPIAPILKHLAKISFPYDLQNIPGYAFANSQLSGKLEIPATCTTINKGAFQKILIDSLVVKGPTCIGEFCFTDCQNLSDVQILGEGVRICECAISGYSRADHPRMNRLIISKGTEIESSAIQNWDIGEVFIADSVKHIGTSAFEEVNIGKLTIGGCIVRADRNAFNSVYVEEEEEEYTPIVKHIAELYIKDINKYVHSSFSDSDAGPFLYAQRCHIDGVEDGIVTITEDMEQLPNCVLSNCDWLRSISLPSGMKRIRRGALQDCRNLTSVNLPFGITEIQAEAFSGCTSLRDITLPASVNTIYESAFRGCSSLENIDLSGNLYMLGNGVFSGCSSLITINSTSLTPPKISKDVFEKVHHLALINVPMGTIDDYYDKGWGSYCLIEEAFGVLTLSNGSHGRLLMGDTTVLQSAKETFVLRQPVTITAIPDQGYYVSEYTINGKVMTVLDDGEQEIQLDNDQILNVRVEYRPIGDLDGIEAVTSDASSEDQYYDLSGIPLRGVRHNGIAIKRSKEGATIRLISR